MIPLAIVLMIMAIVLLTVGLRGRLLERGSFCRRCRFDLQGLDTDAPACPECGSDLRAPEATRPVLRRRRPLVLTLGGLLLLGGIGMGTVALTGTVGSLYKVMPDRVVLYASQWGSDEALDELLVRLTAAKPIEQWVWDNAIEMGLGYQADTSLKWDPRWGEVISLAWKRNQLSEEQKLQFAINAQEIEYLVRDRMRVDDRFIPDVVKETSTRGTAINSYQTGYVLSLKDHASGGLFGDDSWENPVGGSMSTTFSILQDGSSGSSSMGGGITVPKHIREQLSVGDELSVYYEIQHVLELQSDGSVIEADPIRYERTVRVVSADETIVRVVEDPQSVEAITEGARVNTITGRILGSVEYSRYDELASFTLNFSSLPQAISGEVFIQHPDDGERIFVGTVALAAKPETQTLWSHGYQLAVTMSNETDLVGSLKRVTREGFVDVVFMTDSQAAERNPEISEVVNLDLRFESVPVQWFETQGELLEAQSRDVDIAASKPVDG